MSACAQRVFGGGRVIGSRAFCKQYVQAPPGRPLAQRALLNTRVRPRLFSQFSGSRLALSLAPGVTRSLKSECWHQARRRGSLLSCPLSQAMTASPLLRCPRTPPPHRLRIAEQRLLEKPRRDCAVVCEVPHSAARLSTWRRVAGRPHTCVCAARLWERQPPARAR